ncbi:PREDICTED: uncharacterized protein LOC109133493 isoform X1 [Camelina sativa]|uniref:Uncharacterized protein LOC109133493 isoform X1 n=1 Tax=Camelina sativa TaxID=90675 RepID=A0ABM1RTN5_CAMSA|nr:PREDICTED: uncharacterized protein LOC109133493 isoform X1 [Camelina sativa]
MDNPPPATIMLINLPEATEGMFGTGFHSTDEKEYNIVPENDGWFQLIEGARDSESTREIRRGKQFTLEKSCSESSREYSPFYCCLCCFDAQTFESFNLHLNGEKHIQLGSCFFTHLPDQASLDSHPKTATTMVIEEEPPKTSFCFFFSSIYMNLNFIE